MTLVEVLIALLILSVSMLGFMGVTLQGLDLIQDAHHNETAVRVLHDLSERIASNNGAIEEYIDSLNSPSSNASSSEIGACGVKHLAGCSPEQRAIYDVNLIKKKAVTVLPSAQLGIQSCGVWPGSSGSKLYCVVLAWYETTVEQCLDKPDDYVTRCVIFPLIDV